MHSDPAVTRAANPLPRDTIVSCELVEQGQEITPFTGLRWDIVAGYRSIPARVQIGL